MYEINRCLYPGCGGSFYTGVQLAQVRWLSALMIVMIFAVPICIASFILKKIGQYRTMDELNGNGWKALIPFYYHLEFLHILGLKNWEIGMGIFMLGSLLFSFNYPDLSNIFYLCGIVCIMLYEYKLCKLYKHGNWFYLGLVFLPAIFWMILGSEHLSVPVELEGVTKEDLENKEEEKVEEKRLCPKCQAELRAEDKFCSQCGWDLTKKPRKRKEN